MSKRYERQLRVRRWVERVFHYLPDVMGPQERLLRFGEEANELLQAGGLSREEAHRLVDYVYDRPVGEVHQELGGVSVCLLGVAECFGFDLDEEERKELDRIHDPELIARIHAKHAKKMEAGV